MTRAARLLVVTALGCYSSTLFLLATRVPSPLRYLSSWEDSLFGALRHTRTPGGTRLLRASLLQPHADVPTINARLNALQYLVDNPDLFYTLQSILGRFPDIDWLLSMCAQLHKEDTEQRCELRLNYVISLKNTLELLDPLASTLADATDPLLDSVRQVIPLDEVYLRLTNL
nr:mutS protein homolog 4-like [Penaeus vannamei]